MSGSEEEVYQEYGAESDQADVQYSEASAMSAMPVQVRA